jgi:CubicO group peptidase (beta-lactamase class C family)
MSTSRVLLALMLVSLASGCDSGGDEPAAGPRPTDDVTAPPFGIDVPPGSSGSLVAALDGELVTCGGWGDADRAAGTAAGCDTVYDVMSMTKQFTAAAVLKLQMQGRLRVTDPIGAYLRDVPADKRAITVEQLLTHTSGLVDVLGGDYEEVSRSEMEAAAFSSEPVAEPGAAYLYSNAGYSLLAAIVEEASGTSYEEYLARHLFAPAGMTSTGYVLPKWQRADVAVEYDATGASQGRPNEQPWAADGPYWHLRGNGGLLSTARDMFRWHLALEGDRILDRDAKAALFEPWVREEPGGDSFYGYGWVVQDTPVGRLLWHNGGNGWSYGELARIPDLRAMVFWVTNAYQSKDPGWNLEKRGARITEGVVERLVEERDQ